MGGVFCRDSYWGEVRHKKKVSCAIIQLQHLFEGRGERGNFAWGRVTNQPPLYTGSPLSEANNNNKKKTPLTLRMSSLKQPVRDRAHSKPAI